MAEKLRRYLFEPVIGWTTLTTIFGFLPLARIIGKPEGYTWAVAGVSGAGREGPFWVFILSTLYVVTLLWTLQRGPRALLYPMLILWHLFVTGVIVAGVVHGGTDAAIQGQGLHWEIPLWMLIAPFVLFTLIVFAWVALDIRLGGAPAPAPWSRKNTMRLAASLLLLGLGWAFLRAGTNYDGWTAAAIIAVIASWVMLVHSFRSEDPPA